MNTSMRIKDKLLEELKLAFISYQWNLENPMTPKTNEELRIIYLSDHIFHNKVDSLVCGTFRIVEKYLQQDQK